MYLPPAARTWGARLGLALVVAIGLGYAPGQALRRDPRAIRLGVQLQDLERQAREVEADNATRLREIESLRRDVGAIEERARAELGMVYPGEVVLRVRGGGGR